MKSETSSLTPQSTVDIYISGTTRAANGNSVAAYWKNGVETKLTDSAVNSEGHDIAVNGSNVYIVGDIQNNLSVYNAAYWKNGTLTRLPNNGDVNISGASQIKLQGNDVHIAGNVGNNAGDIEAAYWKNDALTILPSKFSGSVGNALAINGNDIYIVGCTKFDNNITNQLWVASYWKNGGSPTILLDNPVPIESDIYAVGLNGADLYTAGYVIQGPGHYKATYWKNGVATSLTDGPSGQVVTAIAFQGSDVYMSGSTIYNGHNVATFWKNGLATILTDGSSNSNASDIIVDGPDIYIAGVTNTNDAYGTLTYWKNGIPTYLSKGVAYNVDMVVVHNQ